MRLWSLLTQSVQVSFPILYATPASSKQTSATNARGKPTFHLVLSMCGHDDAED